MNRGDRLTGVGFDLIEDLVLRAHLVDAAVLQGSGWAIRRLQEVAGVAVDGVIGPVTIRAVDFAGKLDGLANCFAAHRIRKLARIVANDPSQLPCLVGWMARATSFLETP